MKIYKFIFFFLNYLRLKDWLKIIVNYLLIFLTIFLEIIFIYLFFIIVNKNENLENQEKFLHKIIFYINNYLNLDLQQVSNQIFFLCFVIFLKNIFQLYQNFFFNSFIYKLTARKSVDIFSNYLNFNYEKFKKRNISTYSKNILRDVENIILGILGLWIFIIGDLIYIFSIVFFSSYFIFFAISTSQFFLFLLITFALLLIYRLSAKFGKIRSDNETFAFKILNESFNFFKEIKISNKNNFFSERFSKYINKYYYSKAVAGFINIVPKAILEIGFIFFFYLAFIDSNLSIENFISIFSILIIIIFRILQPLARTFTYFSAMFTNLESFKILYNDLKFSLSNKKNYISSSFVHNIKVNNISYSTKLEDSEKEIIKNFNYKFSKGKIYGLYGKSGSGKTTLLLLIAGLLKRNYGQIFFNDKKIESEDILRKYRIGYLPQNPNLFDENLIFNIFLNNLVSLKYLKKSKLLLKNFNLKNIINSEKFLDSVKNFSGGEKQRIGFIRSIINNPQVLLLDEPTSALDRENENLIFDYLKIIKKDMIIIVSSHKKIHKKYFDKIIEI
jgi:ATP-binding cassette subfamily C protein